MCADEPAAPSTAPAKSTSDNETAASAVHTVSSRFSRVVVVRLRNDADLLEGLKTAVAREKIKNAVILSGAGSLTSYHVHVVSNTVFPPTNAFFKGTGPYDLLTTTGYIIDGRVHAHISFSDTHSGRPPGARHPRLHFRYPHPGRPRRARQPPALRRLHLAVSSPDTRLLTPAFSGLATRDSGFGPSLTPNT
jgi:predicted DNA-binding protein with PD1-like motif